MRILKILSAFVVMMTTPAAVSAFTAQNGVEVTGSGASFTVDGGNGFGARGMWCAAADYARRAAGASTAQRLYVGGPSGNRNMVTFTLDNAGLSPSGVTSIGASVSQPGANLSIGHALGFCADHKLIRT